MTTMFDQAFDQAFDQSFDQSEYLKRIGLSGPVPVTEDGLEMLHRAQVHPATITLQPAPIPRSPRCAS
jgi:hypothetical protein